MIAKPATLARGFAMLLVGQWKATGGMTTESQPPTSETNPPKLRGLWEVMYTDVLTDDVDESAPPAATPSPAPTVMEENDNATGSMPEGEADSAVEPEAKPHHPHGLWEVMYTDVLSETVAEQVAPESPAAASVVEPKTPPRSLWKVMQGRETADAAATVQPAEPPAPVESRAPTVESQKTTVPSPPSISDLQPSTLDPQPARNGPSLCLDDLWLLLFGVLSLLLSGLAYQPLFWWSVPAALCGFVAVLCSVAAWLEPRASIRQRRVAAAAGIFGVLGVVAGPAVFAPLGNHRRATMSPRETQRHLQQISRALDQYHLQYEAFPVGGTTYRDKQHREHGGHGWMTALLPFIGANAVYERIDLSKPYDDPANREPLSMPIETYYAAGGKRVRVGPGFAVSHFAGVGGEVKDAEGHAHPAGIFTHDRAIQRKELRDGLSQTLVAGELPGGYPAWGDPGNWRTIGRGLNRESRGFGNAANTGATMLFADGSVRFFSNRTDPELLRKLSTRDAADAPPP